LLSFDNIRQTKSNALYFLLISVPIAIVSSFTDTDNIIAFTASGIALVPLAKLIGDSTEHLGSHYGSTIGSLLNVTFGNAAELIIAISAINSGLFTLVKASITGSILGNILLIFGLSILVGGLKHKEQYFNRENTGIQSSMLFLAIIGLAVPTIIATTGLNPSTSAQIEQGEKMRFLSDSVAFILLIVYVAGILFVFITHKHLFTTRYQQQQQRLQQTHNDQNELSEDKESTWTKKKSFVILFLSIVGVVIVSEILVSSVEVTAEEYGFGELFIGAIIVGLVGNAAEHSSAVMLASRNKLDLSIGIAAGSGTQVALFVAPILVIIGAFLGKPFTLVFTPFELAALILAAIILNWISHDGKSNWFEGVMLTAVFIVIAIGFFFVG
jgi:Ca2+:H+ antiporter